MTAHSALPPSSSARRVQCPASTRLEALYPEGSDEDRSEAAEGEAAHWAASEMLQGRLVDVGQIAPNGVVLTQEMVEGADLYYDHVVGVLKQRGLGLDALRVEKPIVLPRVHAESWGTPDCVLLQPNHVHLWDYKFGHRYVPVAENAQMVEYASGFIPHPDAGVNVTFTVVQPRCYSAEGPIRSWTTTAVSLRALINLATNAAGEAMGADPRARVGPECRDCRARHACPTLQRASYRELDEAGKAQPLELPPAAVGLELSMLHRGIALMQARASGLEAQALAMLRGGKAVPGWAMRQAVGRRKWTRPAAEVIQIGKLMGLDLAQPPEAITPNQATDRGLDSAIVESLSDRPSGGFTLAADDGSKARAIFGAGK